MNEELTFNEDSTGKTEFAPWHIQFIWHDKSAKITLKKGEDLIKVAEMLSGMFTANGIENELEISH